MALISLRVVDLYHNDDVTSFAAAAAAGIWGVIHKATTGQTGQDSAYAARRGEALAAGLLWGAYHWGTNADVAGQVENFLNVADPDDETLVALDFEETEGNQMTLDQAREFLERVADKLGRKPVLYGGGLLKTELGSEQDPFFGGHRLWLAHYSETPTVQASWDTYWLWQYTDSRTGIEPNTVDGIPGDSNGNLDCNSYSGTQDELAAEWAS
ncbi:MAG TPA: glycoside hydrolase family 25 protein [Thermoanaerobaculia bacterium]|nr:glycoside hydrolase family 25 protein [Thermoanaerobaculia bacterium]